MEFLFDGRESAEEQVTGVGHDGGAARSDLVAGEEFVKFGEGTVDGDRGSEVAGVTDELGGDIGGVAFLLVLRGVLEAEARLGIRDRHAAEASSRSRAMLAMEGNCVG